MIRALLKLVRRFTAPPTFDRWRAARLVDAPGTVIATATLYEDYSHWVLARGGRPIGLKAFGEALAGRGIFKAGLHGHLPKLRLDVVLRGSMNGAPPLSAVAHDGGRLVSFQARRRRAS